MERIREKNINTKEYWIRYANEGELEADRRRGGTKCKFASALEELPNLMEKDILDIGCFNGNFYNFILESGRDVKSFTGVDHCQELVDIAQKRFPRQKWITSEYFPLPFESDSFDIVSAFEILEHVEFPEKLIEEAFRVCRPNSIVIISTPNKDLVDDPEHIWQYEITDIFGLLSKYSTNIKVFLVCSTNRTIIGKAIKDYKPYL